MNIETVSELIHTLESAGDLTIREEKFLKLARAYQLLAAENVALKAFGDKLSEMHNALNGEGTGIQGRAEVACQQAALEAAMEEFDDIKTPATDRIVAGIKADGVEMFALMFAEEAIKDNNITTGWKARASRAASEYAELLREGADK